MTDLPMACKFSLSVTAYVPQFDFCGPPMFKMYHFQIANQSYLSYIFKFCFGSRSKKKDIIHLKMTFHGRWPTKENYIKWKTTLNGRHTLMKDDLWWRIFFNGSHYSIKDKKMANSLYYCFPCTYSKYQGNLKQAEAELRQAQSSFS